jgi:site-specific recombinase XerD
VAQLDTFLAESGASTMIAEIRADDVRAYLADQLARNKPATASVRYRSVRTFFSWLVTEGEIEWSPMQNIKPPQVPTEPVPVYSENELRSLLEACAGNTFTDRRDTAIMLTLIDTGMRRSELAGLTVADVDINDGLAVVMGKGSRPRAPRPASYMPINLGDF